MGVFLFLTAAVVEITFAIFCIMTKSNQKKARSMMSVAVFASFVLLVVLPVIDWNFRYYGLAALLLLLAVLGAINLIFKKEEKREYKQRRTVLKAIGMTALTFALVLPAILFPQNIKVVEATGAYQVSTVNYTYSDPSRIETYTDTGENRKLNVEMWYPENGESTYPLIVFSHGAFGIKSSNESLYNELASHGYIVCSIDHTYQCLFTTDPDGQQTLMDKGYMEELSAQDAYNEKQQSYEYFQKWMKTRTDDMNFVIDNILAEVQKEDADPVYKIIDKAKIGVMGHSLGGAAALGMGRMRDDISAVIALESPFMCDIEGVADGEFVFTEEIYPVPVLNVYSDSSWTILSKSPQYAENYALLAANTRATAFNVYISGVGHLALTDLVLTTPILTHFLDGQKSTTDEKYTLKTINKVGLEFFDAYLKDEGEFTSGGTY